MPTASSKPTTRRKAAPADESATAAVIALDADVIEFDVEFLDLDEEPCETHTFRAKPRFGYKRMREAAMARQRGGVDAVLLFERMIVPSLLDHDGTPVDWSAEIEDGEFVDPDGNTRPVSELAKVTAPEAGSSRRRWAHLMDDRDDLNIEFEQLTKAYDLLVEKSSGRPTRRSKSS